MIAGITGHQQIGPRHIVQWVCRELRGIVAFKNVTYGITSLAVGTDQLFAESLSIMGIPYEAIVPCERYNETFDNASISQYEYLLRHAVAIQVLPFSQPSEDAFYAAGKTVAHRSDFMIAVWNGEPARGLGGTADIVNYSRSLNKDVAHVNPLSLTVNWLGMT